MHKVRRNGIRHQALSIQGPAAYRHAAVPESLFALRVRIGWEIGAGGSRMKESLNGPYGGGHRCDDEQEGPGSHQVKDAEFGIGTPRRGKDERRDEEAA